MPGDVFADDVNTVNKWGVEICDSNASYFECEYVVHDASTADEESYYDENDYIQDCLTPYCSSFGDPLHIKMQVSSCGDGTAHVNTDLPNSYLTLHTGHLHENFDKFIDTKDSDSADASSFKGHCPTGYVKVVDGYEMVLGKKDKRSDVSINFTDSYHLTYDFVSGSKHKITPTESDNNNKPWITTAKPIKEFHNFVSCEAILGTEENSIGWILKKVLNYLKIVGPVLTLILSSLDFIKSFFQSDDDSMKKTYHKFLIRIVCSMLLFLVPTLISFLLDIFGFTANTCNL